MRGKQSPDWMVGLRRWFHQHPEVGYREEKTAAKICETLEELKVPYRSGIGGTGTVARLTAGKAGPKVAYRCDMDGLPMAEQNEVAYRSKHAGRMHACGHDGHMAIALGLIRRLIEDGWQTRGKGEILFLFQPAEEGGAGAKAMLDTGLFDTEPLKAIFAAHVTPQWPTGQVELVSGKAFAAVDLLEFTIRGKGGHGAAPDQCVDPIVAAAQLIGQLQGVVSHGIDPRDHAVLTIGQFNAGSAANVIPEKAQLRGTLRTLSGQVRTQILGKIDRILAGLEQGLGVTIELENKEGYPVLVNHPDLHDHVLDCAARLLGRQNIILGRPSMGSEDFAFFSDRWPGMMVWFGCRRPKEAFRYGLHSPHFDLDEAALSVAVDLFVEVITRFLANADPH